MPTSADSVRIAIVPETVYGVTPATPVFQVVRTTGEGLTFAPTTTQSNEINPARQLTDSILTGGQSTGDINFELAYEDWFETLFAGAMCSDWVAGTPDSIKIGTLLKGFTVEKTLPVPGGQTQYHRYPGCIVNGFSLSIRPNQPITGSFTFIGKAPVISTSILTGATYVAADLTPVMTAPKVIDIEIGGVSAVSKCFNNLQITLNNSNRTIECIGTLGPREVVLGRLEAQAQFSVLFNDSALLQTLLDQTATSIAFKTQDSSVSPKVYGWTMPRIKLTANPIVAGGTNQDVINAVSAQGLYDPTALSTLTVTRTTRT